MLSLKHVVSPIRLRLHVTQEVPLPPYFSIAFVTLRTMFNLVGGRVEEVSIVNNAKFLNFFKFFSLLSMVIKEKFSKMKWEKLNFCFSLDLDFVLCLLKLMNY